VNKERCYAFDTLGVTYLIAELHSLRYLGVRK